MASSLWAGGTNTTEGPDNSRISTKGTGFAGIGGTGGASMIVFGTIAGGAGAALTGGNFWQGAATGLIVSGLNHSLHQGDSKPKPKKAKWDLNGDGKLQKVEADLWGVKGHRKSITVDNSKIDWSGLKIPEGKGVGDFFSIDTLEAFALLPFETSSTYGGTSFKVTGTNTVEVQNQDYHYKMRNNNTSIMDIGRDFLTSAGYPSVMEFYNGPFQIYNINYINRTITIK